VLERACAREQQRRAAVFGEAQVGQRLEMSKSVGFDSRSIRSFIATRRDDDGRATAGASVWAPL
jgi:hypothetical protein